MDKNPWVTFFKRSLSSELRFSHVKRRRIMVVHALVSWCQSMLIQTFVHRMIMLLSILTSPLPTPSKTTRRIRRKWLQNSTLSSGGLVRWVNSFNLQQDHHLTSVLCRHDMTPLAQTHSDSYSSTPSSHESGCHHGWKLTRERFVKLFR